MPPTCAVASHVAHTYGIMLPLAIGNNTPSFTYEMLFCSNMPEMVAAPSIDCSHPIQTVDQRCILQNPVTLFWEIRVNSRRSKLEQIAPRGQSLLNKTECCVTFLHCRFFRNNPILSGEYYPIAHVRYTVFKSMPVAAGCHGPRRRDP